MTRLVVDASALIEYLLRTGRGRVVDETISQAGTGLHTPALCDIEVTSLLRRLLLQGTLTVDRAGQALADLGDLPLLRHGHQLLLTRILQLRDNFSAYDAAYVALAERLDAGMVTADAPLAQAIKTHSSLSVIETG